MGVRLFREWHNKPSKELAKLEHIYEDKFGWCPYRFLFKSEEEMIEKLKIAIKTGIKLDYDEDARY